MDAENRTFQDRWKVDYMFTSIMQKPVCLLCGAEVAVLKEYNLRLHYTKHKDRYKDINRSFTRYKALKRNLVSQQTIFKKSISQSEAAVKASFIVAKEITKLAIHFQRESLLSDQSKFKCFCIFSCNRRACC